MVLCDLQGHIVVFIKKILVTARNLWSKNSTNNNPINKLYFSESHAQILPPPIHDVRCTNSSSSHWLYSQNPQGLSIPLPFTNTHSSSWQLMHKCSGLSFPPHLQMPPWFVVPILIYKCSGLSFPSLSFPPHLQMQLMHKCSGLSFPPHLQMLPWFVVPSSFTNAQVLSFP